MNIKPIDWSKPLVTQDGEPITSVEHSGMTTRVHYGYDKHIVVFTCTGDSNYRITDGPKFEHNYHKCTYVKEAEVNIKDMSDKEIADKFRELDAECMVLLRELIKRGYVVYNDEGEEQVAFDLGTISKTTITEL